MDHLELLHPRSNKRFGWKPDTPDFRDAAHAFKPMAIRIDPVGSLFPGHMPPVMNQGDLGSCTGASSSRACMFLAAHEGQPTVPLSALFPYYNGRVIEGTVSEDSGCEIRDVVKGITKLGICAEKLCPYDIRRFATKPSVKAYRDGHFTLLSKYQRIESSGPARLLQLKTAIAIGSPVVFGFAVYESFDSDAVAKTGLLPLPGRNESQVGGHAVWAWAWDDNKLVLGQKGALRVRNSWGEWGDKGDLWMPYSYAQNPDLCDDFWALSTIT